MKAWKQVEKWLKEANRYEYSWTEAVDGDDPSKIELDKTRLNRAEGYEVAPFIYRMLKKHWSVTEKNVEVLEKAIHVNCKGKQSKDKIEAALLKLYKK